MTPDNLQERYARHLMLPDFTEAHQKRLGQKTALVVGLGGLGGHIAPLLCAAGVGRLVLADGDTVSLSNLQRQILYRENQVGILKAECAKTSLEALNSGTKIEIHPIFLSPENAWEIAEGCDIIVDGSDKAAVRYLMNDLAVGLGIPFVYGSIREYSGQLAVFNADAQSATYRCLFPEENSQADDSPRGVISPLPAWVAAMQSHECIRILSGLKPALANRLFIGDLLSLQTNCIDLQPTETGRRISMENFGLLAKQ
ncbi:MAG: HesA/MoeB/ThiF family protein [Bacteroidales bacterium]|nr:HesA/MoeB/ThiF family protein [Bacteroidales bacterium]